MLSFIILIILIQSEGAEYKEDDELDLIEEELLLLYDEENEDLI